MSSQRKDLDSRLASLGNDTMKKFSHLDASGNLRMVDVSGKKYTLRFAKASALIRLSNSTLSALLNSPLSRGVSNMPFRQSAEEAEARGVLKKGDALSCAKIAGILAAKRVHELIPLAHPIPITHCDILFKISKNAEVEAEKAQKQTARNSADKRQRLSAQSPRCSASIKVVSTVKTKAETGVEMEALSAVTVAALTIYDMVKSVERGAVIEKIQLEEKWGGKSGHFKRQL